MSCAGFETLKTWLKHSCLSSTETEIGPVLWLVQILILLTSIIIIIIISSSHNRFKNLTNWSVLSSLKSPLILKPATKFSASYRDRSFSTVFERALCFFLTRTRLIQSKHSHPIPASFQAKVIYWCYILCLVSVPSRRFRMFITERNDFYFPFATKVLKFYLKHPFSWMQHQSVLQNRHNSVYYSRFTTDVSTFPDRNKNSHTHTHTHTHTLVYMYMHVCVCIYIYRRHDLDFCPNRFHKA